MNYKLVFAVIAIVAFSSVKAQENVIKVNPLGLAFGFTELSYERVLSEGSSLELAVAFTSVEAEFTGAEQIQCNRFWS
jgi:hypothetical protein